MTTMYYCTNKVLRLDLFVQDLCYRLTLTHL